MKKILSLIVSMLLLCCCAIPVFAEAPTGNDTYEVQIELWHATKDQVSMGNQYVVDTALIEVVNGTKYITLVAGTSIRNLQFWYYTDGGVTGNTASAEKVSDVKLGGKTYSAGYRFPLVTDNEYVGVKFKAPIMPVTPSARVKIDYSSLRVRVTDAETTNPPATTAAPTAAAASTTTAAQTTVTTPPTTAAQTTITPTTTAQTTSITSAAITTAPVSAYTQSSPISEATTDTDETSVGENNTAKRIIIISVAAAVIVAAIVITAIVIRRKKG